ncbi:MAG: hypothetical protein ACQSGP_26275 [Frankia sp.]
MTHPGQPGTDLWALIEFDNGDDRPHQVYAPFDSQEEAEAYGEDHRPGPTTAVRLELMFTAADTKPDR